MQKFEKQTTERKRAEPGLCAFSVLRSLGTVKILLREAEVEEEQKGNCLGS